MQATGSHEAVARATGNPALQSIEAHPYCPWEAQCLYWTGESGIFPRLGLSFYCSVSAFFSMSELL